MKRNVWLWALQIAVATMFIFAALPKLAGAPPSVQAFETIGFGQWFRYATGLLELVGASLLLVPSLAALGALVLSAVMVGAIATHAFVLGGSAVPAIVLLAATAAIAWLRRARGACFGAGPDVRDHGRAFQIQPHG